MPAEAKIIWDLYLHILDNISMLYSTSFVFFPWIIFSSMHILYLTMEVICIRE